MESTILFAMFAVLIVIFPERLSLRATRAVSGTENILSFPFVHPVFMKN